LHSGKNKGVSMKKILFAILAVLVLTLTACSTSATGNTLGSTENNLPIAAQLAVGTLKLAGTDQAVTAEQAQDLIVYWETYKQLSQSDTAAQAEYDGLIAQIEETLTADQVQAISAMDITQQDVFASMQGMTVTTSSSSSSTVSIPSGSTGGGMPAGGPPADGGGAPSDGGMGDMGGAAPASSMTQAQSAQSSANTGATASVPTVLIEAVIQSLQKITAA
jgi:hypothetical protein